MVAVGAVVEHANSGKILVLQRASTEDWHGGEWEIPYGRISQSEDPEAGLRRELLEEAGLADIEIQGVLTTWKYFRGPEIVENAGIGITFHVLTASDEITLSHEHTAYEWVTLPEAEKRITDEPIRQDLQAWDHQQQRSPQIGKDYIGYGAGAVIYNEEGKLLLTRRGKKARNEVGKWEFPGGMIEYGEATPDGLKREVKEEIGVEIECGELLCLIDYILPGEQQHWVAPTYICKIVSGTPAIQEPEKCDDIGWFTLEEAAQLPLALASEYDVKILLKQAAEKN